QSTRQGPASHLRGDFFRHVAPGNYFASGDEVGLAGSRGMVETLANRQSKIPNKDQTQSLTNLRPRQQMAFHSSEHRQKSGVPRSIDSRSPQNNEFPAALIPNLKLSRELAFAIG